jgi:hypothetical protein
MPLELEVSLLSCAIAVGLHETVLPHIHTIRCDVSPDDRRLYVDDDGRRVLPPRTR